MVQSVSRWDVAFIQEMDFLHVNSRKDTEEIENALFPHIFIRHYGGAGCCAHGAIVNSRIQRFVRKIDWSARALSLFLQSKANKHASLQLIGVHGYEQQHSLETLSEITDLMHNWI